MHALLAKWAPPYERSKLVTFIYAGTTRLLFPLLREHSLVLDQEFSQTKLLYAVLAVVPC